MPLWGVVCMVSLKLSCQMHQTSHRNFTKIFGIRKQEYLGNIQVGPRLLEVSDCLMIHQVSSKSAKMVEPAKQC